MKNKTAAVKIFFSLLIGAMLTVHFQNCSTKNLADASAPIPSVTPLNDSLSSLEWIYTSGTVAPQYRYSVDYKVDFAEKTLRITTIKGSNASNTLPASTSINLNATELMQIKTLVDAINAESCPDSPAPIGGGANYLGLSNANSTEVNTLIYSGSCQNIGTNEQTELLATEGFKQLTDYLQSL